MQRCSLRAVQITGCIRWYFGGIISMNSFLEKMGSFSWQQTIACFWVLFVVIDVLGSVPIIISIKKRAGRIKPAQTTVFAGGLMVSFLLAGPWLLSVFAVDMASFAVAGSMVLFVLGLEMVLNVNFFRIDIHNTSTVSIVPIAFPTIAGTGTLITLLTLKTEYAIINILCAISMNLIFTYMVLQYFDHVVARLGHSGIAIIQKVMGIIVLSVAVKMLRMNLFL